MFFKKPRIIAFAVLIVIAALTLAYLFKFSKKTPENSVSQTTSVEQKNNESTQSAKFEDEVLKNALNLYIQKKEQGVDLSNGPCLGEIAKDWVLDIAHDPRQPIDDKVQNQCTDFLKGRAHHFVELEVSGKLIKII